MKPSSRIVQLGSPKPSLLHPHPQPEAIRCDIFVTLKAKWSCILVHASSYPWTVTSISNALERLCAGPSCPLPKAFLSLKTHRKQNPETCSFSLPAFRCSKFKRFHSEGSPLPREPQHSVVNGGAVSHLHGTGNHWLLPCEDQISFSLE